MKKILFFSHESGLYGAPRSMFELVKNLKQDYKIEIVTFGEGGLIQAANDMQIPICNCSNWLMELETGNQKLTQLINKIGFNLSKLVIAVKVKRFNPDLIIVNTMVNSFGVKIAKFMGIKLLVHVREGANYLQPSNQGTAKITSQILEKTSNFICVSDGVKNLLLDKIGNKKVNVRRVYNGIDCCSFNNSQKQNTLKIEGLENKFIVGYLGSLVSRKGLDVFLSAAREISKTRQDIAFVVVGGSELQFTSLAKLYNVLDLIGNTVFHHPFIDNPKDAFDLFDIFCLTSHIEAFGRVTVEATCANVPVIASATDGSKEIIIHEETGLLFPPGDSESLMNSIIRLTNDPQLREKYAKAGFERVNKEFSSKKYVAECKSFIKELIEE